MTLTLTYIIRITLLRNAQNVLAIIALFIKTILPQNQLSLKNFQGEPYNYGTSFAPKTEWIVIKGRLD